MVKINLKKQNISITDSLVRLPKPVIEVNNELISEYNSTGIAMINGFATIVVIKR